MRGALATISNERAPDRVTVRVRGDIDMTTAGSLRATLADAVAEEGPREVVVDLSATTFFGSSGLAALVSAGEDATAAGKGYLVVAPLGTVAHRAITATGLDELIPVSASD
ncbi:STAS domain-containing protein [Actinokineospora bangkokensis]|uniref:Anti-sigma factor antagonist n=1 Tax=Actinokineospora bangkokensis TaxID=1193682 RepID=A0A1Q9LL59_9PSEU|nr:STAS domain-containing protein [Actinokineospora bangkokensis]OLR92734.1 hypothetical protein BJP25_20760 [Actinokineospora bangkokensis]